MTALLLLLVFLLVVDALVLLGFSDDSRTGRDWQPREWLADARSSGRPRQRQRMRLRPAGVMTDVSSGPKA
jgi:hypothetical protein